MLSDHHFRRIVSGQQRGIAAGLWRSGLRAAEVFYRAAVAWRNRRYDAGRSSVVRAAVPVISVGNLTLGGTGKTPAVAYLARWFRDRGVRVAVVSRGYRAGRHGVNDEALELQRQLPDVPHVPNPDRVAAAKVAVERHNAQLLLLDDGFQHRRLARDLDIVLLDALEPFGHHHVFPRGLLREGPQGLARADVVGLSRADLVSASRRDQIRQQVRRWSSAAWIELAHRPVQWIRASGACLPLDQLVGQPVAAFCGIGSPEGFERALAALGCRVVASKPFADHYRYTPSDLTRLGRWARRHAASALVCTAKDLSKIPQDDTQGIAIWALQVELQVMAGREDLEARLQQIPLPSERLP